MGEYQSRIARTIKSNLACVFTLAVDQKLNRNDDSQSQIVKHKANIASLDQRTRPIIRP